MHSFSWKIAKGECVSAVNSERLVFLEQLSYGHSFQETVRKLTNRGVFLLHTFDNLLNTKTLTWYVFRIIFGSSSQAQPKPGELENYYGKNLALVWYDATVWGNAGIWLLIFTDWSCKCNLFWMTHKNTWSCLLLSGPSSVVSVPWFSTAVGRRRSFPEPALACETWYSATEL